MSAGGKAIAIKVGVSLGLAWALGLAALNAASEWQIADLAKLNQRSLQYYSPGDAAPTLPAAAELSGRASLLASMVLARAAARSVDDKRRILSEEAKAYLDHAETQRPNWAQATLVRLYAYQAGQAFASSNPSLLLHRSYVEMPYMPGEGSWRVSQAIKYWDRLDISTQIAAAREAHYLSTLSYSSRVHVRLLVSRRPIEQLFNKSKIGRL